MRVNGTVSDESAMVREDLTLVAAAAPVPANGTVAPPRRVKNSVLRPREYLTPAEVDALLQTARSRGRYGARDASMILIAFRHGLRVAELVALRWEQIDFAQGYLHVQRVKNGTPSVHPLHGPELRALRQVKRDSAASAYVFVTERGGPMTPAGFRKLLARTGRAAGFGFLVHPHMLRHACGYKLANDGQDTRAIQHYLGHKNITHTVRYTQLRADRFKGFWND
jgi:integrase